LREGTTTEARDVVLRYTPFSVIAGIAGADDLQVQSRFRIDELWGGFPADDLDVSTSVLPLPPELFFMVLSLN
jgi:hypothetical protein